MREGVCLPVCACAEEELVGTLRMQGQGPDCKGGLCVPVRVPVYARACDTEEGVQCHNKRQKYVISSKG